MIQGTKRRVLLTSFGQVEVALRWLSCKACGQVFRTIEYWLAQMQGHTITAELRALVIRVDIS